MADKIPTLFERTTSSHDNSREQNRIVIPTETDIEDCTSKWTKNTLNTLDIDSILTKSFDPMDLKTLFLLVFQVHGELFAQQLINISMIRKKQEITEGMYQSLFQEFAAMFGLTSLSSSVLQAASIEIGNTTVTSLPDFIFPDVTHTDKDDDRLKLLAVCKVTKDFTRREELFPVEQDNNRKRKRREDKEKVIQHLDEALQGQHGGELLVHFPLSENNGLLGIIIQKTYITFSYFQCNKIQFEEVKSRDRHINKPVIYYSRPYNYLKAAEREELIRHLLTLGFIQHSPCCISRKEPYIETVD
ncbi:unnamed protein product [Mytilus coruscus]|uniref:Uncharacterized protein n=1 Tax=Mytilus coruscus TaxID=42192 RepID=A0A6J8BXA7_MYTCO|nr:unnamed protein product [Mytilus coruscus]